MLAERDTHFKNYRELLERLAAAEAALVLQSTPADSEGIRVIDRVFSDMQPEFLGLFATALAKRENTIALLGRALRAAQQDAAALRLRLDQDLPRARKDAAEAEWRRAAGQRDLAARAGLTFGNFLRRVVRVSST